MTYSQFEDLPIWQKARTYAQRIALLTKLAQFNRDLDLKNQIKSSSGSIMDNIAEGFEREGNKEFIQFLYIAKGSSGESRSQLYRAFDFGYITEDQFQSAKQEAETLSIELKNFIAYLQRCELRGFKFKDR